MFQVIVVVLLFSISLSMCSRDEHERMMESAEAQRIDYSRQESQDQILAELIAMDDFYVTRFVADWRDAYPKPTGENLSELRQIEQSLKVDKRRAMKYTLDYHAHNDLACGGIVSAPLSFSDPKCAPGL
ncbi:hypothetical protein [Pseudomonas abietaniphila]|uniref:Uncharacterized protein n=1 Tax=Pseudomonas abietaniphila TaxID=89065 RepID=A0A1G8R326_9PSED|nr:hypothetical protein [Pseudomonas abietaniphila]SDJ11369.1 hypothetical protein SAMN05216605_121149 [Pseudomonas abietaniphila]